MDTQSKIFQNLNGALDEISVIFKNGSNAIFNKVTMTTPAAIHANGPTKVIIEFMYLFILNKRIEYFLHKIKLFLNRLGNYVGNAYSDTEGCIICHEDKIQLKDQNVSLLFY